MGCGQSKIGIYQRKSKNKKNGSKRSGENGEKDGETEEGEDTISGENKDSSSTEKGDEDTDSVTSKIKQMAQQQTGGAVLAQSDISSSQLDFFKMLDEKIENGPDYEESDEEEQKARMANLMEEWKAACMARQQKKMATTEQEKWHSPGRGGKLIYQDDYSNYPGKKINVMATQRFPPAYVTSPGVNAIHIQNPYKINPSSYLEQPRMKPRIPVIGNYHPYPPPSETYNHCDSTVPSGHPMAVTDPLNPLRPQVILRQSSINSQVQHYPENQRLYPENIRQFPDFFRPYHDQRPYQISRTMPTVNVLYEHRMYGTDVQNIRPQQMYSDDLRQSDNAQQRVMTDHSRQYMDSQRPDSGRQTFESGDDQRFYHEKQYVDGSRLPEGPRPSIPYQKPPLLTQRSIPEPPRVYRDLENDDCCYQRQERFSVDSNQEQEPTPTFRPYNPSHFKGGRSLSVEVHYLSGPPPPREIIPLQGAPGPPQGSPRPLVTRGLQPNMHRLPANSVVHFRKPQGGSERSW